MKLSDEMCRWFGIGGSLGVISVIDLSVVLTGFLYQCDRVFFIKEFLCEEGTVVIIVTVPGAVSPKAAELAAWDVIDPPGVVAALEVYHQYSDHNIQHEM